ASKTGVKLENKAYESLSLSIDVDVGKDNPKPKWSKQLLSFSQPLGSECFPINIPGLGPGDEGSDPNPTNPTPNPGGAGTCKPPKGGSDAALTLRHLLPLPLANHRAGREYVKTTANRALAANTYRVFALEELPINVARMLLRRRHVLLPERRGSVKELISRAPEERTSQASVRVETTSSAVPGVLLLQLARSREAGWERGLSLV
ncbi:MAG: hypothetical protein Q9183_005766, partial [Haloplaca sp. 2 TL-2023]